MENKAVVFITGASAGVGYAVAEAFAQKGCKLGLFSRNFARLTSLKEKVESLGAEAVILTGDVANYNDIESAVEKIESVFGPVDIWINNAMATVFGSVQSISSEEIKRVTEVTYLGTVYGTLAALKSMRKNNRGNIVQVGSVLAYRSIPLQSAYCAAKHAVKGFTDSLRSELIHDKSNIRISMVQLPALNTPQFDWAEVKSDFSPRPLGTIYQPEVAAKAIVWIAFNYKRELNVGLSGSIFIWGNKFFPGFGDYYLAKRGYDGQFSDIKISSNRKSNLWQTVEGNYASHGRFDDEAVGSNLFLWLIMHSKILFLISVILLLLISLFFKNRAA